MKNYHPGLQIALSKVTKKSFNNKKCGPNDLFLMLEFKDSESNQFINECEFK